MKISDFTRNELNLMNEIYDKGFITKRSQKVYLSSIGFYLAIWSLRDKKIVTENGVNERREKIWVLTDKGKKTVYYLKEIERCLSG